MCFFVSDYYYSGLVRWKACALLDSCASLAVQSSPLRLTFCSTETSVNGEHSVLDRVLLVRYWSSYKLIHESRVQSLDIYIKWLRMCFIWYEIHTVAVQGVFTPVPVFGQAFIALKAQRNLYLVLPTLYEKPLEQVLYMTVCLVLQDTGAKRVCQLLYWNWHVLCVHLLYFKSNN